MTNVSNPIVRKIIRRGRRQGRSRRLILANLATGKVESNYQNLRGGDADSAGYRQERRSLYRNPRNENAAIDRFYNEAAQLDRGQPIGQLAADVQRPAAQYRGRYKQALPEARQILRAARDGGGSAATPGTGIFTPGRVDLQRTSQFDQAAFAQATRRAQVGQFLTSQGRGGGILFRSGLLGTTLPDRADFTTSRLRSTVVPGRVAGLSSQPGAAAAPATGQVRAAVHAARKKLGVSEVNGSNRGGQVDRLEKRFGMIGQPWCGILVGTALQKAGVRGITSRVASVNAIEEDAKAGTNGFRSWHGPQHAQRGDALVTAKGQHVGLVVGVDRKRGIIRTIEGNTGTGTVARRTHRMADVYGVARPRYRHR